MPKSNSKAKRKTAQPSTAQPSQKPALPQIQKSNCKSKSKTPQNTPKPPKPGNTPQNSGPKPYTISIQSLRSITLSSPEPSPEQTRAREPTARSPQPRKQKQKQNPAKPPKTPDPNPIQFLPGKTPDPNPIQFLSPHKEGATYLDDDRSRPCRRFLQNRFVCLLLKHNPFKSRAQPREQTRAREPTARSPQPENKSKSKTWQNPAKLRTQTLYNFYPRIKKALPIWTMIDLGLAKGFSKTALCVCC